MVKIEMYTKNVCPYCTQAKALLATKGITDIIEYNIETNPEKKTELISRYEGLRGYKPKTVPQIFINDVLLEKDGFNGLKQADSIKEDGKSLLDTKLGL